MKIMILANEAPEDFALREDKEKSGAYLDAWRAYGASLRDAGVLLSGAALEAPSAATVVSVRNGVRTDEYGPFPDTREQLGGFFVGECTDVEAAARWAATCPAARNGFVDVRVVPDYASGE